MKKQILSACLMAGFSFSACFAQKDPKLTEQWNPVPPIINPGSAQQAPSDAIVLFDGKNLSEWVSAKDGSPTAAWVVENGIFTFKAGTGYIKNKQVFEDFQLHI